MQVAQQEGHSHGNTGQFYFDQVLLYMMSMLILPGGAILSGCVTSLAMQELIGKYIVLENYFMSESLSKVCMCVGAGMWSHGLDM